MKIVEESSKTKQVNAINQPSKREPRANSERYGFRFQPAHEGNDVATNECRNCGKTQCKRERVVQHIEEPAPSVENTTNLQPCAGGAWAD